MGLDAQTQGLEKSFKDALQAGLPLPAPSRCPEAEKSTFRSIQSLPTPGPQTCPPGRRLPQRIPRVGVPLS